MTVTLEDASQVIRAAVRERMENTDPNDDKLKGYTPPPLAGCQPAERCAAEVLTQAWQGEPCCEGQKMRGDSLLRDLYPDLAAGDVHPTSRAFYELCDQLKETHRLKSSDYGSADDPLANIRNGAKFVGIEPWRAAMVRLSDKVTRLETYCRTGSLTFEGVEDTLVDLASYALLTLLTHREANREP
jgi:hypothetical protein